MLVLTDGEHVVPLATSQDHKRALEGDRGPNTGGMGVYSPVPIVTEEEYDTMLECMNKTVDTLREMGLKYSGCLYGGFMLTDEGPKILEFNARFGDPETQVILPRMQGDLVDIMIACDEGTLSQDLISWEDDWAVCGCLAANLINSLLRTLDSLYTSNAFLRFSSVIFTSRISSKCSFALVSR